MHINKRKIKIAQPYERLRLLSPSYVLQGHTWYTVSTTPLHYPAIQKPFSPGSMNPLPPSSDDGAA